MIQRRDVLPVFRKVFVHAFEGLHVVIGQHDHHVWTDVVPVLHRRRVLRRRNIPSLAGFSQQHVRETDTINIRFPSLHDRRQPLHRRLVRAHRVVLRPPRSIGHAFPPVGPLSNDSLSHLVVSAAHRHTRLDDGRVVRNPRRAGAQCVLDLPLVRVLRAGEGARRQRIDCRRKIFAERGRGNEEHADERQLRMSRHCVTPFVFKTSAVISPRRNGSADSSGRVFDHEECQNHLSHLVLLFGA